MSNPVHASIGGFTNAKSTGNRLKLERAATKLFRVAGSDSGEDGDRSLANTCASFSNTLRSEMDSLPMEEQRERNTSFLSETSSIRGPSADRIQISHGSSARSLLQKAGSFLKGSSTQYEKKQGKTDSSFFESGIARTVDDEDRDSIGAESLEAKIESALEFVKWPKFIIHPSSSRKIKWDVFVSILIFYSVINIPYRIGFGTEAEGFAYGFDWFVDGAFFFDIVFSFLTAFWDNDELVTYWPLIARHYIKTWFLIDLVSTLPIDLMLAPLVSDDDDNSGSDPSASLRSIKLIKFFRLIRLLKLARLLKLKKFGTSLEGTFTMNPALQRLLKLLLQIVFICHLLACFWFFTSTLEDDSNENWVVRHNLYDEEVMTQYLASFYWTVATMMAVGYGDIHAVSVYERLYSILVQVTGATSFGFIIANISAFIETFDPRASAYRARMDKLKQYMRDRNLPRKLQRRVRKYYDYILSKESIFDDATILSQLPSHLTETIIIHVYGDRARGINFLKYEDGSFVAYIMARSRVLLALSGEVICEQESVGTQIYMILHGKVEACIQEYDEDVAKIEEDAHIKHLARQASKNLMASSRGNRLVTVSQDDESAIMSNANNFTARPSLRPTQSSSSLLYIDKVANSRIGKEVKHAVVAGVYGNGAHFAEVGVIRNEPHKVAFRANKTCDLMSISKEHMDYAVYMYPTSALRFRKRCDLHAELMEQSVASATVHFPKTDRRIKEKVVVDCRTLQDASFVYKKVGRMVLNTLVAHDILGRFKTQSTMTKISTKRTLQKEGDNANENVHFVKTSIKVRRRSRQSSVFDDGKAKVLPESSACASTEEEGDDMLVGEEEILSKEEAPPAHAMFANSPVRAHTMAKLHRKNKDNNTEEVELELEDIVRRYWVVPPGYPPKMGWDIFLGVLIVYSVLLVPYRIGFNQQASGGSEVFDWIVDVVFVLDMIVSFRTAYEGSDDEIVVIVPSSIAKHYLKGWFTVDFLSTFPFDLVITSFIITADGEALRSLKLIKVFRMIRLLKLFRLFKLKKIIGNLDTEIELGSGFTKLTSLFLQITFVAHLFACFWFYASSNSEAEIDTWYVKDGLSPDPDRDVAAKYVTSLYWSFTTMTTVGYGDISPTTDSERLYSIFIMIMGATIFGYVVGSIASLISMLDIADALYKAKMNELDEYLSEQGIPKSLRRECKSCYAYSLSLASVFDEKSLLAALSPSLRHEIIIYIHQAAVDVIPIFKSMTATFISDLIQVMQPQLALPNTFIMSRDDIGSLIFFVVSGEVLVYEDLWPEPDADGNLVFDRTKLFTMGPGFMFGHEGVLSGKRCEISAKSVKLTQLYILSKAAIGTLVDDVPPFAVLLQHSLRRAIRKQDIYFGKIDPNKKKQLWGVVQSRFGDILSMSPSNMKRLSAQAISSSKLEELIGKMLGSGKSKSGVGGLAGQLLKLKDHEKEKQKAKAKQKQKATTGNEAQPENTKDLKTMESGISLLKTAADQAGNGKRSITDLLSGKT